MDVNLTWNFSLRRSEFGVGYELHIWRRRTIDSGVEVMNLKDVTITQFTGEATPIERSPLQLENTDIRSLAAELNSLGFRTDRDAVIEGELKATKDHLADMRTLLKLK